VREALSVGVPVVSNEVHVALLRAISGATIYRNGLVVQICAWIGGPLLIVMMAATGSPGLLAVSVLITMLAGLLAQLMFLVGSWRLVAAPPECGATAPASAAAAVHALLVVCSAVLFIVELAALGDRRITRFSERDSFELLLIGPAFAGQALLFFGISRVARWLRDDTLSARARGLVGWFAAVAVMRLVVALPVVREAVGGYGWVALVLVLVVVILFALGVFFKVMRDLGYALERDDDRGKRGHASHPTVAVAGHPVDSRSAAPTEPLS
jgi:hypothetical protein